MTTEAETKPDPRELVFMNSTITRRGRQRWKDVAAEFGISKAAMLEALTEDLEVLFTDRTKYVRRARTIQTERADRTKE